jgi:hypothetical protein
MTLFLLAILLAAPLSAATIDTATASQPLETTRQQSVADLKERSATLLKAYPDLLKESGFWPISTCAFGTTDRNLLGAQGKIPAATRPLARFMGANFAQSILRKKPFYKANLLMPITVGLLPYFFGHVSAYPKLPVRQVGASALACLTLGVATQQITALLKRPIKALLTGPAGQPQLNNLGQALQAAEPIALKAFCVWLVAGSLCIGINMAMTYRRYNLDKKHHQEAHQLLAEIEQLSLSKNQLAQETQP